MWMLAMELRSPTREATVILLCLNKTYLSALIFPLCPALPTTISSHLPGPHHFKTNIISHLNLRAISDDSTGSGVWGRETFIDLYSSSKINHVIKVNLSVCVCVCVSEEKGTKTCMS